MKTFIIYAAMLPFFFFYTLVVWHFIQLKIFPGIFMLSKKILHSAFVDCVFNQTLGISYKLQTSKSNYCPVNGWNS